MTTSNPPSVLQQRKTKRNRRSPEMRSNRLELKNLGSMNESGRCWLEEEGGGGGEHDSDSASSVQGALVSGCFFVAAAVVSPDPTSVFLY